METIIIDYFTLQNRFQGEISQRLVLLILVIQGNFILAICQLPIKSNFSILIRKNNPPTRQKCILIMILALFKPILILILRLLDLALKQLILIQDDQTVINPPFQIRVLLHLRVH